MLPLVERHLDFTTRWRRNGIGDDLGEILDMCADPPGSAVMGRETRAGSSRSECLPRGARTVLDGNLGARWVGEAESESRRRWSQSLGCTE